MPEEKEKRRSHGEQIHRRRVLAEERKFSGESAVVVNLNRMHSRIDEIESLLHPPSQIKTQEITPLERAKLSVESVWLRNKMGIISTDDRINELGRILDHLEEKEPEVFRELTDTNGQGKSFVLQMSDRFNQPVVIGGYHTKRR